MASYTSDRSESRLASVQVDRPATSGRSGKVDAGRVRPRGSFRYTFGMGVAMPSVPPGVAWANPAGASH